MYSINRNKASFSSPKHRKINEFFSWKPRKSLYGANLFLRKVYKLKLHPIFYWHHDKKARDAYLYKYCTEEEYLMGLLNGDIINE